MNPAAWHNHLTGSAFWSSNSFLPFLYSPSLFAVCLLLMVQKQDKKWSLNPYLRTAFIGTAVILNLRYLIWRVLFTMNRQSPWAYATSILLLAAEIYAFFSMFLLYLQSLWPQDSASVPFSGEEAPSVDVYVTILNEPEEILKRTLDAVTFMDYPADRLRVYVLDDGGRPKIKTIAERFGAVYITRENNKDAKAGNINHALPLTKGEIIAIFDCDHVPVRNFLQETVGFFKDPKVAIVQTPHNFYNLDVFQRNLYLEKRLQNEQDFFYNVLMPGRNRFNSVFFAGTTGLLRRTALEQAGGFRVTSLIEDLYTSMELHSLGWSSVYYHKILSGALAAESFHSYLGQHERWTRGGVQVFLMDNPLFKRGLSFMQRINYFGSILYFFHGLPRIVYLAIPLPFLFFNMSPIVTPTAVLLAYFIPFFVTTQASLALLAGRYRNPFWSDLYETSDCFRVGFAALVTLFNPDRRLFNVTPKNLYNARNQVRLGDIIPHMVLIALLLAGLGLTCYRINLNGKITGTEIFITLWSLYNIFLLRSAVAAGFEPIPLRGSYRLSRALSCEVAFDGTTSRGKTRDISDTGVSVLLDRAGLIPDDVRVKIKIVCGCGETLEQEGTIAWQNHRDAKVLFAGIRFAPAEDEEKARQATRVIFGCRKSWDNIHFPVPSFAESIMEIVFGYGAIFQKTQPFSHAPKSAK